jgi:predicted nucleic acid-binding protein
MDIGPGEAEAIALAIEAGAARIVLDDKKARRIARELGVTVTGTVGVLLRAKQRGLRVRPKSRLCHATALRQQMMAFAN